MSIRYILEQDFLEPHLQLEITEEQYKQFKEAREVLSDALAFEQRYEQVLGNFIAMELAFSEFGLRATIEHRHDYPELAVMLREANRHVANLLTAMRGYEDQVKSDFKGLAIEPPFSAKAKAALSKAYDSSFGYRFMCAIRNHVQHKATAIHGFEGASYGEFPDSNGWVEAVRFTASKTELAGDGLFKKTVLPELSERTDVRRCARQGIQALGSAHIALRAVVADDVAHARATVQHAIDTYLGSGSQSASGLVARRVGDKASAIPLFLNWDEVRLQLVAKNVTPPQVWPRHTPGQPTAKQLSTLREEAQHSVAEAAASIFISEERWRDYEHGLPIPEALFHLYRLQVEKHPTHRLSRIAESATD